MRIFFSFIIIFVVSVINLFIGIKYAPVLGGYFGYKVCSGNLLGTSAISTADNKAESNDQKMQSDTVEAATISDNSKNNLQELQKENIAMDKNTAPASTPMANSIPNTADSESKPLNIK